MNEIERTKERLNRCEKLINDLYERLQSLEIDNVKTKTLLERTAQSLYNHMQNSEGHKI